jgi:hypothetical protein
MVEEDIPVLLGADMGHYLKQKKLIGLRTSCTMFLEDTRVRLRMYYQPKPGDVVVLQRSRGMS